MAVARPIRCDAAGRPGAFANRDLLALAGGAVGGVVQPKVPSDVKLQGQSLAGRGGVVVSVPRRSSALPKRATVVAIVATWCWQTGEESMSQRSL